MHHRSYSRAIRTRCGQDDWFRPRTGRSRAMWSCFSVAWSRDSFSSSWMGASTPWTGPTPQGRWALLSRSAEGGCFNAEYVPQIAAYVEAILDLGYPHERVLFELPAKSLQLDLAILDDDGSVRVLGEAKRSTPALSTLRRGVVGRFSDKAPAVEPKRRGDEQRQLAWRLWTVGPEITWLIGPGHREAFQTALAPLRLSSLPQRPPARHLNLEHRPEHQLAPPALA